MSAATRLDGDATAAGWFAVPSRSNPGHVWSVRYQGADLYWCGCMHFGRRNTCRHVEAVALAVEIEARQPVTPERRAQAAARLAEIEREFSL